jgi:hypothetical protein
MKKRYIFGGISVIAIAVAIGINVNMNSQRDNLSNIVLINVEALSSGEGGCNSCIVCKCYNSSYDEQNNKCLSSNNGNTCFSGESGVLCQSRNSNCGGTNQ